jgi:nitroreductase
MSTDTALSAVTAAITGRRSIKEFEPRPVPRDLITHLLDTAVWAPNHRLTEPWRFYVLDGPSRARLGEIARDVTTAGLAATPGASPTVVERKADEAAAAWASVPTLLYVTAMTDPNPEIDLENYGATCCAVHSLMLAAHAAGLATSWSSGAVAASDGLRALAGAGPDERLVGLIRLGYPAGSAIDKRGRRTPAASHTTWLDPAPSEEADDR